MANFNRAPYYDDFDENKKFLQILFQPGRPVQARELTQLQSILQNQIEHGGAHIFKHGSKVFGSDIVAGQSGFDQSVQYIKLATNDKDGNIVDVSNFVGKKIIGENTAAIGGTGTVVSGSANVSGDPTTLFVRWSSPLESIPTGTVLRTYDADAPTSSYYTANVISNEANTLGPSSVYQTLAGIYFVNGRYIKADAQTLVLGKYSKKITYRIGFDIIERTVSSSEDGSLLDPSSGFSNYTGSGADRFVVDLVLTKQGDGITLTQVEASNTISSEIGELASTNTFFEIARIIDGNIVRNVKTPFYSELEKTLARKFYDQYGNFTADPHVGKVRQKAPSGLLEGEDKFIFDIDGGKSYVHGYEFDNSGQISPITVDKGREVSNVISLQVPVIYNNYITIHDTQNNMSEGYVTSATPSKGFFDVVEQPRVSLFSQDVQITDSAEGANNSSLTDRSSVLLSANIYNSILVGTARAEALVWDKSATDAAKTLEFQGRAYRLYLRDFVPNYVEGFANGVNQIDVTEVATHDDFPQASFYKINALALGLGGGGASEHGFTNGSLYSSDDFSSGADYVTISGFTEGEWNIDNGLVISANSSNPDWIGVQSIRENAVNNHRNSSSTVIAGNNGIITRTTRSGFSPRRLILLDDTSRALWSDAYNGATIQIIEGPGKGDVRRIIDYIGGSSSDKIHTHQGAGDTTFLNSLTLDGVAKRGLALVDREFSAVPTRDTQYRINFSAKNVRSIGINANTLANGQSTSDLRYLRTREDLVGVSPGTYTGVTTGASPEFTTLWNVDAVSGVEPKGSLGDYNTEIKGGIYAGRRVEGDTLFKGDASTLLGATSRVAVRTLKTWPETEGRTGDTPYANTNFTTQRTLPGLVVASNILAKTMASHLYDFQNGLGRQRWYPYTGGGTKTFEGNDFSRYIQVVDRTTGRVVDFNEDGGSVAIADTTGAYGGHVLTITLPTSKGYTTGDGSVYDVIATVTNEDVAPKAKTLVTANAQGLAVGVTTTGGYNLSNGQIVICATGGNNALTELPINKSAGARDSLGISDIYTVKVLHTDSQEVVLSDSMVKCLANNDNARLEALGANNITHRYRLDNGQRNHIYDHGSLILKSGEDPGNGHVLVLVDYFAHTNSHVSTGVAGQEPKYFSVDSYKYTEDFTITTSDTFAPGDVLRSNTSGVRGRIFDVNGTTLRMVNIVPFGSNTHFVNGDLLEDTSPSSTKTAAINSAVANLQISYENIPGYVSDTSVGTFFLRDVLDFRPRRGDGDLRSNASATNMAIPIDCGAINMEEQLGMVPSFKLNSYMGRIDKVVLTKNRNLYAKPGVSGIAPRPPSDDSEGMTLFELIVSPYTFNAGAPPKPHVMVRTLNHKRYTMKDISGIDKRVRNLEYYVALSALERSAKDESVTDSLGLDRFKNGILTDNFNSFNVVRPRLGETVFDNVGASGIRQYTYGMNTTKGHLIPAKSANCFSAEFVFANLQSTSISAAGGSDEVVMLKYDEVVWSDGPKQLDATESKEYFPTGASTVDGTESEGNVGSELVIDPFGVGDGRVPINPFGMNNYHGVMSLNPNYDHFDDFLDTGETQFTNLTGYSDSQAFSHEPGTSADLEAVSAVTPQTTYSIVGGSTSVVTSEEEFAVEGINADYSGYGSDDVGDRYHATMIEPTAFTIELGEAFMRSWSKVTTIPQSVLTKTENSIITAVVAKFMRTKDVKITATGLKPGTPLYGMFGGIGVTPYISSCDMIRFDSDCLLGKRLGRNGFVQEDIYITGTLTSRAKLVAARGNTAYITDITHASGYTGTGFAGPGVSITGNNTGQIQSTSAQQTTYGVSGDDIKNSYIHRSGYVRTTARSDAGSGSWIKLAQEAYSHTNAISANTSAFTNDEDDTPRSGILKTLISITKGQNAGKTGEIDYYDGSTQEAHVSWGSDSPEFGGSAVDANGIETSDTQDYYSLGDAFLGGTDLLAATGYGEFFGAFHIPSNDRTKFTTGRKALTLSDRGDNNIYLAKSWASAVYLSGGIINRADDHVVATLGARQLFDTGLDFLQSNFAGQPSITARKRDGTTGTVFVCTGIYIKNQGGRDAYIEGAESPDSGSADYPYIPYYKPGYQYWVPGHGTWPFDTHGYHAWAAGGVEAQPNVPVGNPAAGLTYLKGRVDGARALGNGEYLYNPIPVKDASGELCDSWDHIYGSQSTAAKDVFNDSQAGQLQSTGPNGDWTFSGMRTRFPSIIPLGGNIAGVKGFATVEDGRIVNATITDHGIAIVNLDDGEQAEGPIWRANSIKNGWDLGDLTSSPTNAFVGDSRFEVSSDTNVVRAACSYIDEQMSAQEALSAPDIPGVAGSTIAQSFTVSGRSTENPAGVFLTGVDLWFSEKPTSPGDQTTVTVELRQMLNGSPIAAVGGIPCIGGSLLAEASLQTPKINVNNGDPDDTGPNGGLPDVDDENSYTTFTFPAPIYLQPGSNYCFVVRCPGRDVSLWASDLRGWKLGTQIPIDVAKAGDHFEGSLFTAQHAGEGENNTWTPDQYKDLMFRFRRAAFSATEGEAIFTAGTTKTGRVHHPNGALSSITTEVSITENEDFDYFAVEVADVVPKGFISQGQPLIDAGSITYEYLAPDTNDTAGSYKILDPYALTQLSNPLRLQPDKTYDAGSFRIKATIKSNSDKVSPIIDKSTMSLFAYKNYINDGGIEDKHITISGPKGAGYAQGDRFKLAVPRNVTTDSFSMANTSMGEIQVETVTSAGGIESLNVYPTGAVTAGKNYSEIPIAETSTGSPSSAIDLGKDITIEGETGRLGGNSRFRYVTKMVKLRAGFDALDLSVRMDIDKPLGTHIHVYYKVLHKDDPEKMDDKNWVRMSQITPGNELYGLETSGWTSLDNPRMIEHHFGTGSQNDIVSSSSGAAGELGNVGTVFNGFKYFAIKIVGFSDNSANVPVIGNLRAIAVT